MTDFTLIKIMSIGNLNMLNMPNYLGTLESLSAIKASDLKRKRLKLQISKYTYQYTQIYIKHIITLRK